MGIRNLERRLNIAELRAAARRRLPRPVFDFLEGGAEDESTVADNAAAFDRYKLLPRFGVDVAEIDPSVTLLGRRLPWPVLLAPTGMTRMFHPDGERAVSSAAHRADAIYTLSTMSSVSIEEIAKLTPGEKWFQVYCFRDRELTREFLARARQSRYTAICVTVDVPIAANRERDRRSGMTIPLRMSPASALEFAIKPAWSLTYLRSPEPILANVAHKIAEGSVSLSTVSAYINHQFDPSVTWADLAWMAEQWDGPLLIKGLLHPDDARQARAIGAKGIIVSNHGGRQLDGASSALDALPRMADAVGGDLDLILDGGVRRGTHVLKALALGARACMVGRPYLYGLCAGGEEGVVRALGILRGEIIRDMALMGLRDLKQVDGSVIAPPR